MVGYDLFTGRHFFYPAYRRRFDILGKGSGGLSIVFD